MSGDVPKSWTRPLAVSALLVTTSVALSASAETTVPASMVMKVYRFGLSTSPTCENMTIYTVEAPQLADFTQNPTLGSAAVPAGTYQCVALEVDPVMTVTPRAALGACTTAPQTFDFCALFAALKDARERAPTSSADAGAGGGAGGGPGSSNGGPPTPGPTTPAAPPTTIDGFQPLGTDNSQVFDACRQPGERFVIYLTTQAPTDAPSNAFRPPTSATDTAHGQPLGAPLVVGSRTTGTFVVGVNAVSTDSGSCYIDNPSFSFESSTE